MKNIGPGSIRKTLRMDSKHHGIGMQRVGMPVWLHR